MKMLSLFTILYVQAVVITPLDLLFKNIFFFYGEHSRFLESTVNSQIRLCELVAWKTLECFFKLLIQLVSSHLPMWKEAVWRSGVI